MAITDKDELMKGEKTHKLTLNEWQYQVIQHAVDLLGERWFKEDPSSLGCIHINDLRKYIRAMK